MKILIVSFTFPPNRDGVSEAAAAMTLGFLAKGWEVDVLTQVVAPARTQRNWEGARIIEYTTAAGRPPSIRIDGDQPDYPTFLTSGKWDVVIFHAYELTLRLAIPFLAKIPSRKVLVSHGYAALLWVRVNKFPFGLGLWCRSVWASFKMLGWLKKFDRVVYLSEKADFGGFFDHWIAKAIDYSGRRVIPNGVDPNERGNDARGFRQRNGIDETALLFLCVANYSRRKDQGYAARAFRKAAVPGSVLVFIGSEFNEHSQKFQTEDDCNCHSEKSGRILWLEKQCREATLNSFAACDAFVLSADHEAQPIALLEAMREGKPWIARQAGCIDLLEGGLCVDSVDAMADAMIRISREPELRSKLGHEGAHAMATRYNRHTYLESYSKLVEELASIPKATPS